MNEQQLKKYKKVLQDLKSSNEETVLDIVEFLRVEGSCFLIPEVMKVLRENENERVKKAIIRFLTDLKEQDCVPYMIDALRQSKSVEEMQEILSYMWQSRLDYSEYFNYLVDLIIDNNYFTAFEAFTIIENSVHQPSNFDKSITIDRIKKAMKTVGKDKQTLLTELITVIKSL
jgi:hypothetical protein